MGTGPIGAGAPLTGPSDIAKASAIDGLQAMSTDRGVEYWWREDDRTVRVARVSCGVP